MKRMARVTDQTIEVLNKTPELYKLLGLVFSIDNVIKSIKYVELSEGSGTTSERVLRGENYHIIENPRYMNEIKCWIYQDNSNVAREIKCKTVGDLLDALY